jgi:hypothetical protein
MDAEAVDRAFEALRFTWDQLQLGLGQPSRGIGAISARAFLPSEAARRMRDLPVLSHLSAGVLRVNGVEVSYDPDADDLLALLDRVDGSPADVVAAFNSRTGRLLLAPRRAGGRLSLDPDPLLVALGLLDGTYIAATERMRAARRAGLSLAQLVEELSRPDSGVSSAELSAALAGGERYGVVAGPPSQVDVAVFARVVTVSGADVEAWAAGTDDAPGALMRLSDAMEARL